MIKRILRVSILLLIVWGIFKNPVEESIAHEQAIEEARIKREERRELQRTRKANIIEEMMEAGDTIWEEAEVIEVGGCDALKLTYSFPEHPYLQIGLIYSSQYRSLYLYGEVVGQKPQAGKNDQEQFEACLVEEGISWGQVEDYQEDFLCGQIFDPWFVGEGGYYTRDELGNLKVVNLLLPYSYCGVDNSLEAKVEVSYEDGYGGLFPQKITTITYTSPEGNKSIQTYWEYYYQDVLERIEAEMLGQKVTEESFKLVNTAGEEFGGSQMLWRVLATENVEEWTNLLYEGNFAGSMTKLAYRREEGEAVTRQWLGEENYECYYFEVKRSSEVFFDQDYVYVRVPVYDWNSEELAWVENGTGESWKVWLAFAWEDLDKVNSD